MADAPTISTLGELRASGYAPRSVKDEVRANLIDRLQAGDPVFPGILGFDRTVVPQIQNALLGRHDFILLGLRGQAKSRIIRMLPSLLDEYVPEVAGSEIHDDPLAPVSKFARDLVAEKGDDTPVSWLHRSARYGEKLATPDTSIADLIGDIDPIKAATQKLTYADEETIHFGIIPRTHRGIFAINELPDLQPRIQVGLLNIMEEQDIQVRGFNVRIPIDVLMVFTANPEDYTNRGSIITPLKDRIDSQILTHYPRELGIGVEITRQEAWAERDGGVRVQVPHVFREVVEQVAFEARASGVRRPEVGRLGAADAGGAGGPDLGGRAPGARPRRGRDDGPRERPGGHRAGRDGQGGAGLRGRAGGGPGRRARARRQGRLGHRQDLPPRPGRQGRRPRGRPRRRERRPRIGAGGRAARPTATCSAGSRAGTRSSSTPTSRSPTTSASSTASTGSARSVDAHTSPSSPAEKASMMELTLEMLHQHSLLGKDVADDGASYADMMGSVLSGLGSFGPDDEDDFDDEDDYRRR